MTGRALLSFALATCFAVALWTHPSGAHAQAADETSSEYRELIEQALAEFRLGNWDEAAGLFEQAHHVHPNARTLRGMGVSAFEGRRYVDALRHLQQALASQVNPLTEQQRTEVQEAISRAERYVAHLELRVTPSNAEVLVNGEAAPLPDREARHVIVDPGTVMLRASAPGYAPTSRELRVVSGARERLEIALLPAHSAGAAPAGTAAPSPAPASRTSFGPWKWVALGAGAAALGGGILFHLERQDVADRFNDDDACRDPDATVSERNRCNELSDDTDRNTIFAVVGYSAATALVGTGILLFALEDDEAPESAAAACSVGVGAASCALRF